MFLFKYKFLIAVELRCTNLDVFKDFLYSLKITNKEKLEKFKTAN